jgi:hypothetical protein
VSKQVIRGGLPAKHIRNLPHLKWWDRDDILNPTYPFDDSRFRLDPL